MQVIKLQNWHPISKIILLPSSITSRNVYAIRCRHRQATVANNWVSAFVRSMQYACEHQNHRKVVSIEIEISSEVYRKVNVFSSPVHRRIYRRETRSVQQLSSAHHHVKNAHTHSCMSQIQYLLFMTMDRPYGRSPFHSARPTYSRRAP